MSEDRGEGQKILANYLGLIADKGGWWYRLPLRDVNVDADDNATLANKQDYSTDIIMPHFGKIFGLTEHAAAVLLEVLGLVTFSKKNKKTFINHDGWENLCILHKVEKFVEPMKSRINGETRNVWFVRLGTVPREFENPSTIFRAYRKNPGLIFPPTSLCDRKSTKFVITELSSVLKRSSFFAELYQIRDSDTEAGLGQTIDAGLPKDKVVVRASVGDDDADVPSTLFWSATDGDVPSVDEFPLCNKFGIPTSNRQTVEKLMGELAKILQFTSAGEGTQ